MTLLAPDPADAVETLHACDADCGLPTLAWEVHRPRRGQGTAIAYLRGQEVVRVRGAGLVLRWRIAAWTWLTNRRIATAYARTTT